MLVVGRGTWSAAADAAGDAVSPWATGGAKTKTGDTDGKPGGVKLAQVPVAQAQPLPGYVIQGGAIPKDWQSQAVPYQGVGPDGKPITMYYAPTYTFTYPIGPPVMMASPVNRRQAYGQPAAANGWNYQTSGAAPPAYALPPQPTVARYQPQPYQYPPSAPQLAGTPLAPPAAALSPPPSQWVPSAPAMAPPSINSNADGQMLAAAAPAAMAGVAALATQPSSPPPLTAAVSTAPPLQPVMQPVSVSPQSASLAPIQPQPPAKAQKLGLWAQPNPTPPWDYRKTATK